MTGFSLVVPWIGCGIVLAAFIWLRLWIQKHLFGVGYLFAQERHLATVIYCIVLFPGIFIHEATRYFVAGMLGVKHKRVMKWPKADANGRITIAFVIVEDKHNPVYTALIGIVPLAIGLPLAIWISTAMLHLPEFVQGLSSNNISIIGHSFQVLLTRPDFFLWFYLLFVLSNTLWPTQEDRLGWEIFIGIVVGVIIFLALIGFQVAVIRWFTGPIPQALTVVTTILLTAIAIDGVVAIIIALLERGAERVTHRTAPYHTAVAKVRPTRPEIPHLTSISQYRFPLPPVPKIDKPAIAPVAKPVPGVLPGAPTPRPATAPATAASLPGQRSGLPPASPVPTTGSTGATPLPAASPNPNRLPTASPVPAAASTGNAPRPASPIPSNAPPVRPALPATSSAGTNSGTGLVPANPVPTGASPLRAPSPFGSGSAARPSVSNVAHPDRKEDYIDAETIDEEEADQPPSAPASRPPDRPANSGTSAPPAFNRSFGGTSTGTGNLRPASPSPAANPAPAADDSEPRYEPLDDAP